MCNVSINGIREKKHQIILLYFLRKLVATPMIFRFGVEKLLCAGEAFRREEACYLRGRFNKWRKFPMTYGE